MRFLRKIQQRLAISRPHRKTSQAAVAGSRTHVCRFEQMEPRELLSVAPSTIHVGATYLEDSSKTDSPGMLQGTTTPVADLFEVSFTGGANGTELTTLTIQLDNTFFDTAPGGLGVYGSFPFTLVSQDGFQVKSYSVADGGTTLTMTFSGFNTGEKLVFSIDVDEQGNLQPNAVAEGAELEGATLTTSFTAPHTEGVTISNMVYYDVYDFSGTGLDSLLPNDNYDNAAALAYVPTGAETGPVYTAGASGSAVQEPLAALSGTVYYDLNADNQQAASESGIPSVTVTLYQSVDGADVSTGIFTTTDANGNYTFTDLKPGTYKVVETQPDGYVSVGSTPGTVDGVTRGTATNADVLSGISLGYGEDSVHNNFAETKYSTLSGHVYYDANNNGVKDAGETGIAGAQVTVANVSTGVTYNVSSQSDGSWSVSGLMPGQYKVTEVTPPGYLDGLDAAGSVVGIVDGTVHNPGDLIDGIVLAGGQSGINYDFGELLPASVSGYVYVDANNNGVKDPGEAAIADVQLTLLDADGNALATTSTDTAGYYHFDGLTPGAYAVAEAQPAGYYDGLDAAGTAGGVAHNPGDLIDAIPLASGVVAQNYNFGELLPASVSGTVFVDLNNNGVIDSGEKRLPGVTVYLEDASGNFVDSTTTDLQGKYSFADLQPGTYAVEEVQPDGYLENSDWVGSVGGESDGVDRIVNISLGQGVAGTDYNFTETLPGTISGYVFQDGPTLVLQNGDPVPSIPTVRDGKLTADDTRLGGVTLILCDGSGVPLTDATGAQITAVTDATGYYEFTGLEPGVYSIKEVQPHGYIAGVDTAGSNGGLVVDTYTYSAINPEILSTLAVTRADTIIARITLKPGDTATQYNFSEVLVKTVPPVVPPVTPPGSPSLPPSAPFYPLLGPPMQLPGVEYTSMGFESSPAPQIVMQPLFGGSGGPAEYTWHLSVIDGGSPRNEALSDKFTAYTPTEYFDAATWTGDNVDQGEWVLADQNGVPIKRLHFGLRNATPVTGDWDGSGCTKVGVFIDGLWFFDLNGDGHWDENDLWAKLGRKGDQPVAGDWDGDGKTDIGIFGPSWIGDGKAAAADPGLPDAQNTLKGRQKNVPPDPMDAAVGYRTMKHGKVGKLRSDLIDHVFQYGTKGDIAVVGDWNGDGVYTIGIFRNGTWFLDMDGDGRWSPGDVMLKYGQEGDLPVVGDWTGDGVSKVGVYRNGTFYLDSNNNHELDAHDKVFALGGAGDKPVVGDWTGDGVDKVGVYHDGAAGSTSGAVSEAAPDAVPQATTE